MQTILFIEHCLRRAVVWPILLIGVGLVSVGGALIVFSAWALNIDVSEITRK